MATSTTRRPGRAAHLGPERRRPQVLDAALAIAVDEGIAAISVGTLAARLNVTRPVIYACYDDRVAIIRALLDREESALVADVLAALAQHRPNATEDDFVDGFQMLLAAVSRRIESWRLLLDSHPDPTVAEYFGRARRTVAGAVERHLAPALVNWGIADLERKQPILVEFFMSVCEGAVRSLLHAGATWTPAQLGEFIGRATYRAMRQA